MKSIKKVKKDKEAKVIQTVIVKVGEIKKKKRKVKRRMKAKSSSTTQPLGGISVAPQFPMLQQASIIAPSSETQVLTYPSALPTLTGGYGAGEYRKLLEDIMSLSIQSGQQKAMAIQRPLEPIVVEPATTVGAPSIVPEQAKQPKSVAVSANQYLSASQKRELRDYLKTILDFPASDKKPIDKYIAMLLADGDRKEAFLIGLREGNLLRDDTGYLEENARLYLTEVFSIEEIAPI